MRSPAVAGTFYEIDKSRLRAEVEGYIKKAEDELATKGRAFKRIYSAVAPHAGYIYSGPIAGFTYAALKAVNPWTTFVILCPNHTGMGSGVAMSRDDWMTPLGIVKNDRELGDIIKKNSSSIDYDEEAHLFEHSAEVQLPFLQTLFGDVNAVEIAMASQSYDVAVDVANAVWQACRDAAKEAIIIASSDFTHYEPAEKAKETDTRALKLIEQMKPMEFVDLVEMEGFSICGYGAIAAAMIFAQKNGAKAELLKYGSSGDATGDYGSVVGYASIVFHR